MINKRLTNYMEGSKKYIGYTIIWNEIALLCNIIAMFFIGWLLQGVVESTAKKNDVWITAGVIIAAIIVRMICDVMSTKMSYYASVDVKKKLREAIYQKLLKLGSSYHEKVATSEVVQVGVEGIEQLEIYFGRYLPQFFYSLLAPITLFVILVFVNYKAALVLLLCVPLIPMSIVAVQKFAKRLLSKYWGIYTGLGDSFLENLQGLTTLKIYQADGRKSKEMDLEAEHFRKITMKVLTMQLNSVSLMDLLAFGGAALGIIVAVMEYKKGNVSFAGTFVITMLSAEFFIPLRLLGSFFHIAMNGMAASEKLFRILDMEEEALKNVMVNEQDTEITLKEVSFSYEEERQILNKVSMTIKSGQLVSIVGKSGCGKSTIASLLMGMNKNYNGSITLGRKELSEVNESSLMKQITLVNHDSYLFKGTVRENLLMGNQNASEGDMIEALKKVHLYSFIEGEDGLDTKLQEKGSNFSGGQRQRLAIARALLHDSPIYIFDEATSNIDVESENQIMEVIRELATRKTVILISHRLANVVESNKIYVMRDGKKVESGTHKELLDINGMYADLYKTQAELESYGVGGGKHA